MEGEGECEGGRDLRMDVFVSVFEGGREGGRGRENVREGGI